VTCRCRRREHAHQANDVYSPILFDDTDMGGELHEEDATAELTQDDLEEARLFICPSSPSTHCIVDAFLIGVSTPKLLVTKYHIQAYVVKLGEVCCSVTGTNGQVSIFFRRHADH
jgi:hypothetical protein